MEKLRQLLTKRKLTAEARETVLREKVKYEATKKLYDFLQEYYTETKKSEKDLISFRLKSYLNSALRSGLTHEEIEQIKNEVRKNNPGGSFLPEHE